MINFKQIVIMLLLLIPATSLICQVRDIKEDIKNDKSSTSSSKSYSSTYSSNRSSSCYEDESFGDWIAGEIFYGIVKGVGFVTYQAQSNVLENRDRYPNIISFEAGLDWGTTFSENTLNPSVRLNWGIFASDFRYSELMDNTGRLRSWDWQVLVVRVPIKNLKINYGIGFTSILDPVESYFESSTGFDLNLINSKLNFNGNYRWTKRKSDERYRQEVKVTGDFTVINNGTFHVSPMIGCTYQEYFGKHHYLFLNAGFKIRLGKN
ncbi:hypothetical protein [Plebeiibacterium sediminum]|uniref:Uncharacterized protein n=1 Tax=Plebeiibacterium sediminum TaxID=2992112 RepID=A0AAE3M5B3_9BACT|nr:hypothetical protein [Plebeiobacterium sediminum]MCW3787399.1 hypothetical protein [Plebeiobacterium sediminum]